MKKYRALIWFMILVLLLGGCAAPTVEDIEVGEQVGSVPETEGEGPAESEPTTPETQQPTQEQPPSAPENESESTPTESPETPPTQENTEEESAVEEQKDPTIVDLS